MRNVRNEANGVIISHVRRAVVPCLLASAAVLGLLPTNQAVEQTCAPPPPDMVSWWPGDGNANDIQGNNDGTLQNGATFAAGIVGQAFSFDGVNDYVQAPDAGLPFGSAPRTLELWMKPGSNAVEVPAIYGNFSANDAFYIVMLGNSTCIGRWGGGDTCGSRNIRDGNWHHVALTYDGVNAVQLFIDGSLETSAVKIYSTTSRGKIYIGSTVEGSGQYYNGLVDEVTILSRALSLSEIQAIYNAGGAGKCEPPQPTCVPSPPNMVGWWPADGNANDVQGSNNGTLKNGANFAPGKIGQAFNFDGAGDYVDVGTNLSGIGGNISVVTWIKTGPSSTYRFIAGNRPATLPDDKGWELVCLADGKIEFEAGGGARGYRDSLSNTRDNQWHHVVAVRDGAIYSVYVDGVIENGATASNSGDISSTAPLYIGKTSGSLGDYPQNRFGGLIDEFQVYNRALSQSEIQAMYNAGSAGVCRTCTPLPPNMVSWLPGDGNANDIQGNNNGTLQNGVTFTAGKVGQAFSFSGSGAHVRVPDNPNLYPGSGSLTVDAWIRTPQIPGHYETIISHYECANSCPSFQASSLYALYVDPNGKLEGELRDSTNAYQALTSTTIVADNLFHHVALVRDTTNNQFRLVIDGVQEASAALTVTGTIKNDDGEPDPVTVGAEIQGGTSNLANLFSGVIDEVEYFNRALAQSEIQAIYNAGSAGKCKQATNSAPVASAQSVTTNEDDPKAITLTGFDPDGDALTYTITSNPSHGGLSGTAPNVTYTPNADYNGSDSFSFKVNDGQIDSVEAIVSITVSSVNDAPVANSQSVTTNEDSAKAITLTASDPDGDALTFTLTSNPSHGALSGTEPNVIYTPNVNYNGNDSFTFKVNDGQVDSADATVSITVSSVNDAPVADSQSVTTNEDVAKAITLNASDADGNGLTYTVTGPSHGTLSGTAPNVTYTPNANYNGPDSFKFKVNDGTIDSNEAMVSITITPVNDAPVADSQSVTTNEDTAKAITLAASDVDGDSLTYTVAGASHGALSGTPPNVTYTPTSNYNGSDSFTFKVNDGTTNSGDGTVSITVSPVNDAPTAASQSVTTNEDTSKAITLTGSDADGDALTYSITGNPSHGALSGTAPNVSYTPAANYNGSDSFTFKVRDGQVDSAVTTVSITVTPVNDVPAANSQSVATNQNAAKAITLTGFDVDGDALNYAITTAPLHGALSGSPPNVTYTPAASYDGSDSFTFKVNDGQVDSAPATVAITVNLHYNFAGFFQPIDNGITNSANAGQTIPIKWRLTDASGVPISDPSSFVSVTSSATAGACGGSADAIETYSGSSGLQYLGDGNWQFNWKTPKSYAGQCRTMSLNLKDGAPGRTAGFIFK